MTARFATTLIFAALLFVLIAGCIEEEASDGQKAPVHGFRVVAVYPHDPLAFTQGLAYRDGVLYEGTGLYGGSALRETRLETGEVVRSQSLPPQLFGEGIALWEDRLVQLTWRSGIGLVWDLENLTVAETFVYPTEGWGITSDGRSLIMSDGSSILRFLDPETFRVTGTVEVLAEGAPLQKLNELEYVEGLIYANVWETEMIAIISPETGVVVGWIDLSGLLTEEERLRAGVLNGIAYDPENDRLLVTGKLWPKIFQIEVATKE
jgi:glutamine cyclotransferase